MPLRTPYYYIIQSLQLLSIDFRLLNAKEAETVRFQVIGKFSTHRDGPIWQNLLYSASLQNPNGWRMIDEYLAGASFILFFDETEDRSMIEFSAGTSLTSILEECPGFEFYITNHETTYLLCFNHHDFLIGAGKAVQWKALHTTEAVSDLAPEPDVAGDEPPAM